MAEMNLYGNEFDSNKVLCDWQSEVYAVVKDGVNT